MDYTIADIRGRVLALLDENPEILDEKMEYCDPGASIDTLIDMHLLDAARQVVLSAPLEDFLECETLGEGLTAPGGAIYVPEVISETDSRLCIKLPDDFLRLISFRMYDWPYGVSHTIPRGSGEWHLRNNPSRSHHRRHPGVSIRQRGAAKHLEVYASTSRTVAEMTWATTPRKEGTTLTLPEGLLPNLTESLTKKITSIMIN